MNINRNKFYCSSPNCQNKCGRKLSSERKKLLESIRKDIQYAYFCGYPEKLSFKSRLKERFNVIYIKLVGK
jgi:hypothetical protein